jgi:hypothetical protein
MPPVLAESTLFEAQPINGADGTFAPAKNEPVYSWYAYLEGYAPAFVETLRRRFMPSASRIIDPFAGTGTTPLALAELGITCGYCEVNPAMRFVIRAKIDAVGLAASARAKVSRRLNELASELDRLVGRQSCDQLLRDDYVACFGKSEFFEPHVLDDLLRLRTLCDAVGADDSMVGDLLSLAIIANIVSCSKLKRAGDVRYKTESELAKGVPPLIETIAAQLLRMARHLPSAPPGRAPAALLAADAKDLEGAPPFGAEGVITSPPYLNGTNYIRNTKLELWFLRAITRGADLRTLRDDVVTSGINDVTTATPGCGVTTSVEAIVRKIERAAYDQRIHRMVSGYFHDMHRVFRGLWAQTIPGAVLCVDIGDSRYAGINVPTQDLLVDVAADVGFECIERVPLRARVSKDRSRLSQDVLVLRRGRDRTVGTTVQRGDRRQRWHWFRDTVPHQQPPYTKRNWGHPLHSVCSYNGKMKPSLAHFLVHCFSEPGDLVLDPFSGAGTIPFEAALQGRKPAGFDISLMAAAVTNAKICPPNRDRLESLLGDLETSIARDKPTTEDHAGAAAIRFNRSIPEYFHERTLNEILLARRFFKQRRDDSPEWSFALACMLHVLHGNRPYALSRRSHPVTPFAPTGPTEYRRVMDKLRDKIVRGLETPLSPEFVPGRCFVADICGPWPRECERVDAIITSPPFFDSTRFYMTNWMRYWFCGWDRGDFDTQPAQFIESLQRQSLGIYRVVFERFREHLAPDGVAVLHLGQSKKCDMAQKLSSLASEYLAVDEIFTEDVTHCEKHGLSDKGTVTAHQYLVLTKR